MGASMTPSRQPVPRKPPAAFRVRVGPEPSYLARLGVLYAHPIRMKIVAELYMREMSPTQWVEEFGGGSYGKVLGHFKKLEEHGWLRNVRSQKAVAGRGRTRDLYRATELAVIDDDTWTELPTSIQVAFTARTLRQLGEQVGDALAGEAADAQGNSGRPFSCRSIGLDDLGWQVAMAALHDCFLSFAQEQLDAKVRLDSSPERGLLMTVVLAGFESSPPRAKCEPESERLSDGDLVPLRLSDEGLPLSTRMAKVFADPLNLQIIKALHSEAMSPSQLFAKLGGSSVRSVDRKCQTLTDLGWLVRLGRETEGPPVFYRAAGPEAFDADLWGGIPKGAEKAESWPIFAEFCKKAEKALREGSFNARQDRHVTFCTFLLDERGWHQVSHALSRCYDELSKVAADAQKRAASVSQSSPPFVATFLLGALEGSIELAKPRHL